MEKNNSSFFVISEFVDANTNSTGYYWNKIIKGLSSDLKNFKVISTKQSNNLAKLDQPSIEYINIKIGDSYNKNSIFKRVFGQIRISISFFFAIIKNVRKRDTIFSGTNPSFLLAFIALSKVFIKFRWIILVHDIFPENLVASKIITKKSFLYSYLSILFNFIYSQSDELIVIGKDMEAILNKKTNFKKDINYIPNWVDLSDIDEKNNKYVQDYRYLNFQFFGNIGRVQGIQFLLDGISKVSNHRARFVFTGSGSDVEIVKEYIKTDKNKNVFLNPPIKFNDNDSELFNCDIAIISLAKGMKGLAVPSKAYFSMAADKPILVIGEEESELHNLLQSYDNLGWFVMNDRCEDLAKCIDQLCKIDLSKYKGSPRKIAAENFEYKNAMNMYLKIINDLK
jgi:hypothetical protein